MQENIKKVAIIGMGIAGISVLREWTKETENNPSVHSLYLEMKKHLELGSHIKKMMRIC